MSAIVQRAKEIIFSMEGNYSSVNANDNGAVSIGCVQWHGNRAKMLLRSIIKRDEEMAAHLLAKPLVAEIKGSASWEKRTVDYIEKKAISMLLNTTVGRQEQDKLADKDIQSYINHIVSLGFCEEETVIFLADIENQGGAGASTRIGKQAIKDYGQDVTLEEVVETALNDRVFKKYQDRRKRVYRVLTGKSYNPENETNCAVYVVKKGDNLTVISKRFGTTVERLVRDNNIKDKNLIYVGQELKIIK